MRLRRTCREVTALVLQAPLRPHTLAERLVLRLHWLACRSCRRFRRQNRLLDQALGAWRTYRESDADAAEPDGPDAPRR